MTPAAERYDFSEPPPGYEVGCAQDDEERLALVGSPLYSVRLDGITPWAWNEPTSPDLASCGDATTRAEAVAGAWAHHKARHDPPGMLMWVAALLAAQELPPDESGIRAAAWAWYERRLALALRFDLGDEGDAHVNPALQDVVEAPGWSTWPRILTWTDEQVAEVERRLVAARVVSLRRARTTSRSEQRRPTR